MICGETIVALRTQLAERDEFPHRAGQFLICRGLILVIVDVTCRSAHEVHRFRHLSRHKMKFFENVATLSHKAGHYSFGA